MYLQERKDARGVKVVRSRQWVWTGRCLDMFEFRVTDLKSRPDPLIETEKRR